MKKTALDKQRLRMSIMVLFLAFAIPLAELSHAGVNHKDCQVCAHLNFSGNTDQDVNEEINLSLLVINDRHHFSKIFLTFLQVKTDKTFIRGPPL